MGSRPNGLQGRPKPEPIDVEEFFDTYVRHRILNLEDHGIEAISRNTYEREKSEKPTVNSNKSAGPPRASTSSSNFTPPPRRVPNGVNHPSQISRDAIQQIRQQQTQHHKRPSPSSIATGSQKRRKLDSPLPSAPVPSSSRDITTIPVGPPGRRVMMNLPAPSPNLHERDRPSNIERSASRSIPTPVPASQSQSLKRDLGHIDLTSDGEELQQKKSSPPRKKQKQKQKPVNSPQRPHQDLPYIVVVSSSEDEGNDVEMTLLPQSELKIEDFPPEPSPFPDPGPEPEPSLPAFDEDDESDWDPFGDIGDSAKWNSSTYHLEDEEDEADRLEIARLQIGERTQPQETPEQSIHPNTSKWAVRRSRRSVGSSVEFVWDRLCAAGNVHARPRKRLRQGLMSPSYARPWNLDFDLDNLKMQHCFKKAPGTVNKIEQNGQWTAIASASVGGLPDSERDERAMAYNRPGSLLTWGADGLDMPLGHTKLNPQTQAPVKYYAVHDVKFDPLSTTIVSSGADQMVRVWSLSDIEVDQKTRSNLNAELENKTRWSNDYHRKFKCVPHDIVFKPDSSTFAVAEKLCHIYQLASEEGSRKRLVTHGSFCLYPKNQLHTVGSMVWGTGPTTGRLFASSEPDPSVYVEEPIFGGTHKVYNVVKKAFEYEFDATEAGDIMAIDSTGGLLAISTRGAVDMHILRLYDIRGQNPAATSTIRLETFQKRSVSFEGEVNCAAFSPDGLYLALGRNDNRVHIYDTRMLKRGPLLDYVHLGESRVTGEDSLYGVVKAEWIWSEGTRRNALVTGGEDGCVRLWDPFLSGNNKENGTSVARMNSDIAHFSLGDRFKGEHQLVAGDSSGEVMIFNNIVI